jgi:hypothetical protein
VLARTDPEAEANADTGAEPLLFAAEPLEPVASAERVAGLFVLHPTVRSAQTRRDAAAPTARADRTFRKSVASSISREAVRQTNVQCEL